MPYYLLIDVTYILVQFAVADLEFPRWGRGRQPQKKRLSIISPKMHENEDILVEGARVPAPQ